MHAARRETARVEPAATRPETPESSSGAGGGPDRLWNRSFAAYWIGIVCTALGDAGLFVALPFLVLEAGGGAGTLATVLALGAAPRFLGPLVGTLADRVPLRLPVAGASLLRTGTFAALGAVAIAGHLPIALLFAAAPLNGLLTTFVFSAGNVALPHLVPRTSLARANGLMQGATMGLPLVGFGAAGAAVAAFGPGIVVLAVAPLFAVMAASALLVRFPAVAAAAREQTYVEDLRRGAAFVLGHAPLAFLLVASLVINASLNALNVIVPIVMDRAGAGAAGYGLFEAIVSGGLLGGIVAVGALGARVVPRLQIAVAQGLFVLGFAAMAGGSLPAMYAGGAVLGIGLGMGEVAVVTLLQLAVPDGLRGKAVGVVMTANAAGLTLGAAAAGPLLAWGSASSVFAGAAALGGGVLVAWLLVAFRRGRPLDLLMAGGAVRNDADTSRGAEPPR